MTQLLSALQVTNCCRKRVTSGQHDNAQLLSHTKCLMLESDFVS